ncbi:hypothetical protein KUV51_14685 [Tateyamaria omphalii]|uniref:hypothetical protein n=1 Tax=Tateyamaria omphalii TaxID=299262 RepID=UPI001C98EDDE|nr:hypothetical protein [Tateyamaria omphalii]MBY5934253.1 hypothetical protein [Tateyamaria omphalii]
MDYYDLGFATGTSDLSGARSVEASPTRRKPDLPFDNVVAFPGTSRHASNPADVSLENTGEDGALDIENDLWARDVFLVCDRASTAFETMNGLSDRMQSLTTLNNFKPAFQLAACCDGSDILLALDLDAATNIGDTFIQLSELRQANKSLAVLTMSQSFSRTCVMHRENSDFSDASLRLPASEYEMSVALHFAVTNAFFRTSYDNES